jgi:hypothetical protein
MDEPQFIDLWIGLTGLIISMDNSIYFHSLWCSADFALHGWLTGCLSEINGVVVTTAPSCAPSVRLFYLTNTRLFAGFQTTYKKGFG